MSGNLCRSYVSVIFDRLSDETEWCTKIFITLISVNLLFNSNRKQQKSKLPKKR